MVKHNDRNKELCSASVQKIQFEKIQLVKSQTNAPKVGTIEGV